MSAVAVEALLEENEADIATAYLAGRENFRGFPFSVWVLDCDDSQALALQKAWASASRFTEISRKGKYAELPPQNQIEAWMAYCRGHGTKPVSVIPMRADVSMKVAKAVDRGVFEALRQEPSEGEFWVIVISGGDVTMAAFPRPD